MKIAVVFPGIGYHVDKPLLYYSKKIAASAGCFMSLIRKPGSVLQGENA